MTRTWFIYASPVAFAAGLFLAHCSSSSSSGGTESSSNSSSSKSSSNSSTSTSASTSTSTSKSSSSSESASTSTSTSTSGSGSSSSSATESDAGLAQAAAAHAGDQAATCTPPAGGDTCSPGSVSCGGTPCAVPTNQCCQASGGGGDTCAAAGTACSGTTITCNEAADCATGEICCIASENTTVATVSCQVPVDGKCPSAQIATQQICRSNAECSTGKCQFWNCLHNVIEACDNPVPGLAVCTVSEADGGPPGTGSGS